MDRLYNYVFHYNHHQEKWAAIPRGKEALYFNNMSGRINTGILFSQNFDDLVEFICAKKQE